MKEHILKNISILQEIDIIKKETESKISQILKNRVPIDFNEKIAIGEYFFVMNLTSSGQREPYKGTEYQDKNRICTNFLASILFADGRATGLYELISPITNEADIKISELLQEYENPVPKRKYSKK